MTDAQMVMRRLTTADWLRKGASRTPEKEAYVYSFKGKTTSRLTYYELNQKANRVANALTKLGVKKGDKVAILSHNCPQFAVYLYAMAKIGAWIAPLNFSLRGREITDITGNIDPVVFIVEDTLVDRILALREDLLTVKNYIMIKLEEQSVLPEGWMDFDEMWSDSNSDEEPVVEITGDDVLNLMFTSGTEAKPKAVMNTYDNWNATIALGFCNIHVSADTVSLISTPMYHVGGMHLMYNVIAAGGTVVMHYEPDVNEILQLIDKEKVTFISYPPTVFVNLLKAPVPNVEEFVKKALSGIKYAITFGSPIPEIYLRKLMEILPDAHWINYYGQSEMTSAGIALEHNDLLRKCEESVTRFNGAEPIGQPHIVNEVKIVDDNDNEVPYGTVGEIIVRSPSIMAGYYKEEAKTAETFKGGWHHTGDLGIMDEERYLYFVDRKNDMVKPGGENVSTVEVEGVIYNHPNVAEATVVGVPHPKWLEAVVAFVIPKPGMSVVPDEIVKLCKDHLAGYKVPKKVIILDELPKNASGKILKKELRVTYKDTFEE